MSCWDRVKTKQVLPPTLAAESNTPEVLDLSKIAFLHSFGLSLLCEEAGKLSCAPSKHVSQGTC